MAEENYIPLSSSVVYKSITTYQDFLGLPTKYVKLIMSIGGCFVLFSGLNLWYLLSTAAFLVILKFMVGDDPIKLEILLKNRKYPKKID